MSFQRWTDIPADRDTVGFPSNLNNQNWLLILASKVSQKISVWHSLTGQTIPTVLMNNFAAWLDSKWGKGGERGRTFTDHLSDYGTRTWPRPGSHPSTSSFTGGRLGVATLNVRGSLRAQDLDKLLIWMRDEVIDGP